MSSQCLHNSTPIPHLKKYDIFRVEHRLLFSSRELFNWGVKPFIPLGGRVCRWVLFQGHSRDGNAASAPSAPCSCPTQQHRRKLELAPGRGLAWKCPKGLLVLMLPAGAVLEEHRAAKRRLVQNSPEQTSSTLCAAQSWPSTQISASP